MSRVIDPYNKVNNMLNQKINIEYLEYMLQ